MKHIHQPLVNKTKVTIHGEKSNIDKDEISNLILQQPNKKFLGLWKFKLWAYQKPENGKNRSFKYWMREKFGEAPVYHDAQSTQTSLQQMKVYLDKTGHFNSKVWDEQKLKNNKLNITYHLEPADPYHIRKYSHRLSDSLMADNIRRLYRTSLIKEGDIYNAFIIDNERDRIADSLKNVGYFNFNKEYIYFEIDSSLNNHELDITLVIKDQKARSLINPDSIVETPHEQFHLNKIYVNSNYDLLNPTNQIFDTLEINIQTDTNYTAQNTYYFLHQNELKIKPKIITQSLLLNSGDLFNLDAVKKTYRRLADLRIYKYSNIQFTLVPDSINYLGKNLLDCRINLARSKVQSYTLEAEGTNSGGDLGLGGNLVYANKNIFRGSELFQIRLKGALEIQKQNSTSTITNDKFLFFNTLETGVEMSLSIPKFLIPISLESFPKDFNPKTTVSTGINYQQRPKYRRYITNISFGYNWSQNEKIHHFFSPIEVNSVKVYPTPEFKVLLEEQTNVRLKNQYTDHLITALKYNFIFNDQDINKLKNFIYFRGNFETSGFLLKGFSMLAGISENNEGYNTLFNIRYAQYVRADFDFRYYTVISKEQKIVWRSMIGIGVPYGNSDDLPFEKGFYAGGANGMRGWKIRSLGPGSSATDETTDQIDRIGDIQMEANIEYRFPIYSFVKGAFYLDAGNVWLLKENDFFPGGNFKLKNFASEIALDAGFGLRFDFNFFIFRLDAAMRLKDPANNVSSRWVSLKDGFNKLALNFGIGYPF
ncbi:MAG: BamA/TamA family outer membrane protein [Bacteroidetes bacterium]|nr:BamA/TamA family outer membrane protein [Bacteroidota bacterium]